MRWPHSHQKSSKTSQSSIRYLFYLLVLVNEIENTNNFKCFFSGIPATFFFSTEPTIRQLVSWRLFSPAVSPVFRKKKTPDRSDAGGGGSVVKHALQETDEKQTTLFRMDAPFNYSSSLHLPLRSASNYQFEHELYFWAYVSDRISDFCCSNALFFYRFTANWLSKQL